MPRPPGAPPGAGKLGGLFKRRGKEEAFIEDDSPEDSQAPAADGSAAAGAQATAEVAPEPAPAPYETWAWPSIEPKQEKRKVPVAAIVIVLLLVLGGAGFGVYKLVHKDKKSSTPAAKAAAPAAKKPKPKPAAAPSKAKAEKAFAGDIEAILAQSVAQRGKLVQVLAATENGCSIPIAKAKQQVDAVAAGRQSLLAKAKGLSAPTAQATKVKGLLTKALAASLAANRHYAAWVGGLAGASPCPGSTSGNADFAAAGTASVQASSAKQAFTKAFNPLARRVGQKTWSPDAI
jgi:hypothetical protein